VLETDALHVVARLHVERGRIDNRRVALHVADLPQPPELAGTAGQLADHLVLPITQLGEVDARLREMQAPRRRMPGLGQELRDVQQRLRRDAPAIDADAAGVRLTIDEGDLHAQVGGEERGGVAPGPGAKDGEFGRVGSHECRFASGDWHPVTWMCAIGASGDSHRGQAPASRTGDSP
jgi:hypothetical protein